jgi:hypothetical protein
MARLITKPTKHSVDADAVEAAPGAVTGTISIDPGKIRSNRLTLLLHLQGLGVVVESTPVVEGIASIYPTQHLTLTKDLAHHSADRH